MDPIAVTIDVLVELLRSKVSKSEEIAEFNDLPSLNKETKRQKLELELAHAQAKVAQELAIADRIQNANEVILEEYYEGSGKGQVGVSTSESGLTVGASGEARRVTKRVYRFVGRAKEDKAVIDAELD